ncbi:MAG: hypothetical protein M1813_002833 [Trichoglossum hirsutum]|nr:MAG: hypothetical protein M1813_002833 [Trichoglossum hirsutum]
MASEIAPKLIRPYSGCFDILSTTLIFVHPVRVVPGAVVIGFRVTSSGEEPAWKDLLRFVVIYNAPGSICETFFYTFLSGYQCGLESYWNRSVERGKAKGGRESTPGWYNATLMAKAAIEEAKLARIQWEENKIAESERSAEKALEYLAKSIEEAPNSESDYYALYTEEMEK